MSNQSLTEEQKQRIEANKQRALAKRAEKLSPVRQSSSLATSELSKRNTESSKSDEIKKRIEDNRLKALEKREKNLLVEHQSSASLSNRLSQQSNSLVNIPPSSSNKNFHRPAGNTASCTVSQPPNVFPSESEQRFNSASAHLKNHSSTFSKASNFTTASQGMVTSKSTGSFSQNPLITKEQFFGSAKGLNVKLKGKCVLQSTSSFSVEVGYCAPLIEYFKQMKTRSYDASTTTWSFKLEEYDRFIKGLRNFKPDIEIEELPKWILHAFGSGGKDVQEIPEADLSCVDEILVRTLMPFQCEGVNLAIHHNGRLLIADDMGLGKTLQALCIAAYYRKEWPLLVVSPSSVRFDWAQQICKWLPSVCATEINVVATGKSSATSGLVNIISYDLLSKKAKELMQKIPKVIIMDESHFLKNPKTVRTSAAMPLLKKAKRVLLLSGTPALSRPKELFGQITAVLPDIFKFHDFGLRYCNANKLPWGWDYSGASNMVELQLLLERKVMIRRQKKDVLSQLPSKTRQMVLLDPQSIQKHKDLKAASVMMSSARLKGMERRGALLQYFHETCKAKLSAVRGYLMDLLESDKKFLVFAHHREMLDGIEDCIVSQSGDVQYIRIDGRTSSEERNFFCRKFQTDANCKLAILSITAANAGLNLSAGKIVVFAELFWNPGILVQAEDRVHRIGQKDSVSIQYLIAQGTADDYIWPLVQGKLDVLSKAGLTKDDFSDADTKRITDRSQQSILEMFNKDFIDDTPPEVAAPEDVELITSSPAELGSQKHQTIPEVSSSPSKQSLRTPTKRGAISPLKKSSQSPSKNSSRTPTKRQATITSFWESPPKKTQKIDTVQKDNESRNDAPMSGAQGNSDSHQGKAISGEDFLALEGIDWDEEIL